MTVKKKKEMCVKEISFYNYQYNQTCYDKGLYSAENSTQQKKTRNDRKRCQWHELYENMKAEYSLNFHSIWTIVYKGLPAKYSASSEVQQNAGVAIGTVGQEVQSKVKGIKVAERIPIHVYSTDKRKYHFLKQRSDICENVKWTEIQSNNKLALF